ncbi:MAG TPA: pyruvate kinase [Candidatus Eisenbacteria bacterium]|nr:pyruvate kinase [Candidatus Eisenbacteria bacterium]
MSRRARIVCTLGPATREVERIRALIQAGMDVARLNFSHGSHEDHHAMFSAVREASASVQRPIAVLADLQGPKIRLGRFSGGAATLVTGSEFVLTTESVVGTAQRASTTYEALPRDVKRGDAVLLDDGAVSLEVLAVDRQDVRARVVEGGKVSDHKGINLPGVAVSAPALTHKDVEDLRFALDLGVDLVALSFVRDPADAGAARHVMKAVGRRVPLIAKLEKPEAVVRIEEVIDAFDGLMVARGDLGVEMPLEQVPLTQRRAVRLSRERGKPVIVATQMLESMIHHSRPTRAEVTDVAAAVFEGADALMLSGETSVGEHPIEATAMMARIIETIEASSDASLGSLPAGDSPAGHSAVGHSAVGDSQAGDSAVGDSPAGHSAVGDSTIDAVASAAARMAVELGACALAAFTVSGATARGLARHRPPIPILAFTTDENTRRHLALVWGVESAVMPHATDTDVMIDQVNQAVLLSRCGRPGESVVIVAGTPPGVIGSTNTIRVHRLGS